VREALGYDDERPLVVCSVGGTSVGADLLRLCVASYPHIQDSVGDVRMVVVCGPRIDPASIEVPSGVEVRGYVPRLYEHLAACDVAVVQGGGPRPWSSQRCALPSSTSRSKGISSRTWWWQSGLRGTGQARGYCTPGLHRRPWPSRWSGNWGVRRAGQRFPRMAPSRPLS